VEGLFRESVDTVEGKAQHERVDAKTTKLPKPEEDKAEQIHSRSVTLSSEQHHVIAKMDLAEAAGGLVTPVDYKHSAPRETENGCGTVAYGSHSARRSGDSFFARTATAVKKVLSTTKRLVSECASSSTKN